MQLVFHSVATGAFRGIARVYREHLLEFLSRSERRLKLRETAFCHVANRHTPSPPASAQGKLALSFGNRPAAKPWPFAYLESHSVREELKLTDAQAAAVKQLFREWLIALGKADRKTPDQMK